MAKEAYGQPITATSPQNSNGGGLMGKAESKGANAYILVYERKQLFDKDGNTMDSLV